MSAALNETVTVRNGGFSDEARARSNANLKSFKPGHSGNPKGRPRDLANFHELCRGYTEKALSTLARGLTDKNGNVRIAAAKELLDRGWGKSTEIISASITLNMSTDDRLRRISELLSLLNMTVIDGAVEPVKAPLAIQQTLDNTPEDDVA